MRLLYHIKAVFLAPDGATEKHGNIVNAIFNFVYDKICHFSRPCRGNRKIWQLFIRQFLTFLQEICGYLIAKLIIRFGFLYRVADLLLSLLTGVKEF